MNGTIPRENYRCFEGIQSLAIETAPYIYYVENHPMYVDKMDAIIECVEMNTIEIYTSAIALTELLIKPIQTQNQLLIDAYRELLTDKDYIHLISITPVVAEKAAFLRATYGLRTPDAFHIVSAIISHCDVF